MRSDTGPCSVGVNGCRLVTGLCSLGVNGYSLDTGPCSMGVNQSSLESRIRGPHVRLARIVAATIIVGHLQCIYIDRSGKPE